MFFIIDGYVYDRKGRYLGELNANLNYNGVIGETLIIPDPNCDTKNSYILISSYVTGSGGNSPIEPMYDKLVISYDANDDLLPGSGLYSVILDASNNFNQSDFFIKNIIGPTIYAYSHGDDNTHGNTPYFAATKVLASNKRFVYLLNGIGIFRLKIENNNLTYDNYFLDLQTLNADVKGNELGTRGEMELITLPNGNLRLGFPIGSSTYEKSFGILDFNPSTGNYITGTFKQIGYNTQTGVNLYSKGVEFSPDGSKFFVSHTSTSQYPSTLDFFDLNASNPNLSRVVLSTVSDFSTSQIESGDGVLLIPSTSQLYKIENPNSNSPTVVNYLSLSGYNATYPYNNSTPFDLVRLMQDQIDGENYSDYVNTVSGVTVLSYTATTNGTWTTGVSNNPFSAANNQTVTILNELIIPAGKIIYINDMTFRFAPDARVLIQNGVGTQAGGKLIINNTIFTASSECNTPTMWRGVEVWGNATKGQAGSAGITQGKFEIKNGSKIEHAIQGVSSLKFNKTLFYGFVGFLPDAARSGGIINANNATFHNNHTDVFMSDYTFANSMSSFINCTFQTNGVLNIPNNAIKHIQLYSVKGLNITTSKFENLSTTTVYPYGNRGIGIYASYANFYAQNNCIFNKLTYGIQHLDGSSNSVYNFIAKGNRFTNNEIGITVQGSNLVYIDDNYFEVLRKTPSGTTWQTAGVYLNGATAYRVEGNNLTFGYGDVNGNQNSKAYGVVVNGSGITHNEIYRNTFDGLYIGGQSEGVNGFNFGENSSDPNTAGLQWICNVFKNTQKHDLTVVQGLIDYNQGYVGGSTLANTRLHAARNTFSLTGESMNLVHDIKMDQATKYIQYVHLTGDQKCDSYTPSSLPAIQGVNPHQQFYNLVAVAPGTNDCPVKNSTIIVNGFSGLISGYNTELANFQAAKNSLNASNSSDFTTKQAASEYAYANSMLTRTRNDVFAAYLADTSLSSKAKFISFLTKDKSIESKRQLLGLYLADKNIPKALNLFETVDFGDEFESFASLSLSFPRLDSMNIYLKTNAAIRQELINLSNQTNDVFTASKAAFILNYKPDAACSWEFLELSDERSSSTTLLEEIETKSIHFTLFPNPAQTNIRIQTNTAEKVQAELHVFDVMGKLVASQSMNRTEAFINVEALENGIYLVQITDVLTNEVEVIRFVKN